MTQTMTRHSHDDEESVGARAASGHPQRLEAAELTLIVWLVGSATPRWAMQVNTPAQQRVKDVFTSCLHAYNSKRASDEAF